MRSLIFIDTVYIIALSNRRDQYHERASKLVAQYKGHLMVITDAVLLEVGNALARSHRREAAEATGQILASDDVEVVHLTPDLFQRGFTTYKSFQDKASSLVDCLSFLVMRDRGITGALLGIRGADAIYVALAKQLGIPLLTLDEEQLTRGASTITTLRL